MNVYQKAAIVALRVSGCGILIAAILQIAIILLVRWSRGGYEEDFEKAGLWILFGILLLLQSARVGRWIGSDLG